MRKLVHWLAAACAVTVLSLPLSISGAAPRSGDNPSPPPPEKTEAAKPNVVVIMTDDLNLSVLNTALGQGWMPNLLSQVAMQGTVFTKNFVSYSFCCPSRATFFTGRYTHNHNVWTNEAPLGGVTAFDDSSHLGTWLQSAGYRTALVGKWLNGYGADLVPNSPKDDPTYVPPGWDDWQAYLQPSTPDAESGGMYDYRINDNGTVIQYGHANADYETDVLAARAIRFLRDTEANDSQPWFLYVATFAPHADQQPFCTMNYGTLSTVHPAPRHIDTAASIPLPQPPNFNEDDVSDKPESVRTRSRLTPAHIDCLTTFFRNQIESMRAVDDLIGAVIAQLQAGAELDDTVIIFTSDNGLLQGEHRLNAKIVPYEESIRVPLYIRAPGYPAQTTTRMSFNTDLAPTIMDFAQATPGGVPDGRSLVPLLANPNRTPWRKQALLMARTGQSDGYAGIRASDLSSTPNEVYIEHSTGEKEFYDLAADPYELKSLHSSNKKPYPAQRAALAALLAQLRTCAGATCRSLEDQ
jgi:N-acetylglucosamine-6-sulfatase